MVSVKSTSFSWSTVSTTMSASARSALGRNPQDTPIAPIPAFLAVLMSVAESPTSTANEGESDNS